MDEARALEALVGTQPVYTQIFEPLRDAGEAIVTVTFDEHRGKTRLVLRELYPSKEALDGAVASGMEHGIRETMEQLDQLVASLTADSNVHKTGTSHLLLHEKPELCAKLVIDFLTSQPVPTLMPIRSAAHIPLLVLNRRLTGLTALRDCLVVTTSKSYINILNARAGTGLDLSTRPRRRKGPCEPR